MCSTSERQTNSLYPAELRGAYRSRNMTANYTQEQKLAIIAAGGIFGKPYKADGEVYFTVYGDKCTKYRLDEAVEITIEGHGKAPKYVNFSVVRDGYSGKDVLIAQLAPRIKFCVTRGEGWSPSFIADDRRDAEAYLRDMTREQRERYIILEVPQINPFAVVEVNEPVKVSDEEFVNHIENGMQLVKKLGCNAYRAGVDSLSIELNGHRQKLYVFKNEEDKIRSIVEKLKALPPLEAPSAPSKLETGRRRR